MELLTDAQRALFGAGGSLGHYDVLKPIGKGKFSVVYKAQRRRDGVAVALKKIAIFDLMDARAREKTLKEVRLVQSVAHENIMQYLDAFLDGKELYIAFEWADAGDLKRQIRKANERHMRLDERTIWKYFTQICAAILHLHCARIMHRDLKPANILLTTQGIVKVGDLGLGRHLSENTLEAHSKVGTPLYMSPEVLRGEGYDWKSDVWSLGCILYELAMLRSPFKAEGLNLYGLFQKINKGDYEAIPEVYSDHLRALVTRMISLDATRRPTMEQVWAACQVQPSTTTITSARQPSEQPHDSPATRLQDDGHQGHKTPAPTPTSSRPSSQQSDGTIGSRPSSTERQHTKQQPHHPQELVSDEELAQRHEHAAMELLYERLQLLVACGNDGGRALRKRLTRHHFLSESRAVPVWTQSPHERFKETVFVATWLLRLCTEGEPPADDGDDATSQQPPVVRAQRLLLAAERAGVGADELGRRSAASLTKGCGLDVCLFLNALSVRALEATRSKRQRPVYPREPIECVDADEQWEIQSGDDHGHGSSASSGEATMSTPLNDGDDGDDDDRMDAFDARWLVVREPERRTKTRIEEEATAMIHTQVDATAWRREVERAQGKLVERWRQSEARARTGRDQWLTRLERLQRENETMNTTRRPVLGALRQTTEERQRECKQLQALETRMQSSCEAVVQGYGDATARLQHSLASAQRLQLAVNERATALSGVETSFQTRIQQLEELNARVTDSSPLRSIKTQLKRLQEENAMLLMHAQVVHARVWNAAAGAPSTSSHRTKYR